MSGENGQFKDRGVEEGAIRLRKLTSAEDECGEIPTTRFYPPRQSNGDNQLVRTTEWKISKLKVQGRLGISIKVDKQVAQSMCHKCMNRAYDYISNQST
jgi:hypothetical protein